MSQEEFDNRLRSSFQDEYLPPKDKMWVNISKKLDVNAKKPVWYWLLPSIIAVICVFVWIGISVSSVAKKDVAIQNVESNTNAPITNPDANRGIPLASEKTKNSVAKSTKPANPSAEKTQSKHIAERTGIEKSKKLADREARRNRVTFNPQGFTKERIKPIIKQENPLIANEELLNWLKHSGYTHFNYIKENETLSIVALNSKKINEDNPNSSSNSNFTYSDFTEKHWFNFGIGPLLAINSLQIESDSQEYVHKQLWENRNRMTSNGTGLQAFAQYGYKFGKKNKFMFETGLNYSLRTEDIKLNESSFDIAGRDNNGKIVGYAQKDAIALSYNSNTGQYDTTFYSLAAVFSLAVSNKYHVFTIPLKLSYEQKLSESTFFSAGLGAGISMITSRKSEHINMVREKIIKQGSTTQFCASSSANIGFYTNFNNMGQIGVYTTFQMYMSPWKVNSNQYAFKMQDAQFGIMFRRPLR